MAVLTISLVRKKDNDDLVKRAQDSLAAVLRREETKFPQLVEREELWEQAKARGQVLKAKFESLVVCGIGGSSLGAQVVSSLNIKSRVIYLDNVDASHFEQLLNSIDLTTTGFLFTSKSGSTIETLACADFIVQTLIEKKISMENRFHVMTESKDNELGRWALEKGIPLTLIPHDVGGRYSVLSPVGMLVASYEGLQLDKFRKGAREALSRESFVAELMAQFLMSFDRQEWISVFWFYDQRGGVLGAWLQQLWAESLGKEKSRNGTPAKRASTPMTAVGAVDQHSFLQQVIDGHKDKFVVFIRSLKAENSGSVLRTAQFKSTQKLVGLKMGDLLRAEALATEEALASKGVSTLSLCTEDLDEVGLGEFFMTFQLVVAGLGEYLGLNPYDQPGVELGKVLATSKLNEGKTASS